MNVIKRDGRIVPFNANLYKQPFSIFSHIKSLGDICLSFINTLNFFKDLLINSPKNKILK